MDPDLLEKIKILEIKKANDSVPHSCYIEKIGCGIKNLDKLRLAPDNPETELIIESVRFGEDLDEILERHSKYFVFEDKMHEIMENSQFTYKHLIDACIPFINKYGQSLDYHVKQIQEATEFEGKSYVSRTAFYESKGMSLDEAQACAFAISFYTGEYSNTVSRGTSIVARKGNVEATNSQHSSIKPILYYMVKALSVLPFYWGPSNRAVDLTQEELDSYQAGDIVTWLQFSSSKEGKNVAGGFTVRNTVFILHSLTGRKIRHLSNYKKEEEVLYLPHSHFICLKKEKIGEKYFIYMRQIELGLSYMTILWVDDKILYPDWENRRHMEWASAHPSIKNIRFIPKTNTSAALSFLKSPFGKRLCSPALRFRFRIITDMTRLNEEPSHDAGARFLKAVRDMGITTKILIFTSNEQTAWKLVKEKCANYGDVTITTQEKVAKDFIQFK